MLSKLEFFPFYSQHAFGSGGSHSAFCQALALSWNLGANLSPSLDLWICLLAKMRGSFFSSVALVECVPAVCTSLGTGHRGGFWSHAGVLWLEETERNWGKCWGENTLWCDGAWGALTSIGWLEKDLWKRWLLGCAMGRSGQNVLEKPVVNL